MTKDLEDLIVKIRKQNLKRRKEKEEKEGA